MSAGDAVRRVGPILLATFAAGAALVVGAVRAIDRATRSVGQTR